MAASKADMTYEYAMFLRKKYPEFDEFCRGRRVHRKGFS